jgi:exodeoxyribonuclease VII small subunit
LPRKSESTPATLDVDTTPPSFEAAFSELQTIVQQLEDGGLDLERALALFDRGNRLAAAADQLLSAAELRVTRLTPESASTLLEPGGDTPTSAHSTDP